MPHIILTCLFAVVLTAEAHSTASAATFPASHSAFYYSEQNWYHDAAAEVAIAVNPGSYIKVSFTGSASPPVLLLKPNDATKGVHYMNLVYSIDDWEFVELAVLSNTTSLPLLPSPNPSSKLSMTERHNVTIVIYNSLQSANRWSAPHQPGGAALQFAGLSLDSGAQLLRRRDLHPKRCIFFGDSITEGVKAQCHPDPSCTEDGDLCDNSATKTWGRAVASALDCEYSQIGYGSLGWTVPGGGGVVPFYVPGMPNGSSWAHVYAGAPRTFTAVDYVFVLHATNDGLRGKSTPAVTASVHGWLGDVRAAVGDSTHVFLTVPFGSFGAAQTPVGALAAGFKAYQSTAHDQRTHYVDLGPTAARGLTHFGIHSVEACGGIHPRGGTRYSARHGELGAMIAVQATLQMNTNAHL
eukprot:m.101646 g.101646  ORF g.101646 m.101646 type:complete len:410 (-) comp16814_c0_seq1:69-1298(-)